MITERIDADPEAEYLIDFIPNLKYMLRAKFLQENITEALVKFEEKVRGRFAWDNLVSATEWLFVHHLSLPSASSYTDWRPNACVQQ